MAATRCQISRLVKKKINRKVSGPCSRGPLDRDRAAARRGTGDGDLDRYAALHAQTYGESVDAVALIPHMLEAFIAGDRGFHRRARSTDTPAKTPSRLE